jgi:hypothetical protein
MAKRLDHDDAMELAVQLTCSYLGSSHSASTNAEELIFSYYQQIRNVENRLQSEVSAAREADEEEVENLTAV